MTPDTEVRKALLAKVEEAKGPDRELDARILCALLAPDTAYVEQSALNGAWCIYVPPAFVRHPRPRLWETPIEFRDDRRSVTASIDAALALVERVLLGWSHESGRSGFGNPAWCRLWNPMKSPGESNTFRFDNDAGSEPLAILGALLTAVLAQGGQHGS